MHLQVLCWFQGGGRWAFALESRSEYWNFCKPVAWLPRNFLFWYWWLWWFCIWYKEKGRGWRRWRWWRRAIRRSYNSYSCYLQPNRCSHNRNTCLLLLLQKRQGNDVLGDTSRTWRIQKCPIAFSKKFIWSSWSKSDWSTRELLKFS